MEENKSVDLLGIAPYGQAIKIAVEKSFDGLSAILSRICLPATEELGLFFRDKVRHWRLNNVITIVKKSEGKIDFTDDKLQLHPRIAHELLESGSFCDDETLQNMWSGLLNSSLNGSDQNILFINVLKILTPT